MPYKDPAKKLERKRRYYRESAKYREAQRERYRNWRDENKDHDNARMRKRYAEMDDEAKKALNKRKAAAVTPEQRRKYPIKHRYGLTPEQYEQMVAEQEGMCAICKCSGQGLHIDHDHVTGKVRKLLCSGCNRMLGDAGDRIEVLQAAISYLNQHKEQDDGSV